MLSIVMSNMTYTQNEINRGNMITWTANRLQYASNATKLQVSTQLFDRALLNRNGVMDIWNMAHVEDGDKYYIRKEYTEVSQLNAGGVPKQPTYDEPTEPTEPKEPTEPTEPEPGDNLEGNQE